MKQARERILEAALGLIASDGLDAVTNRRVARRASVSLGSLTYHFQAKEDLLRECLEAQVQEKVKWIEAAAGELQQRRLGPAELGAEIERLAALATDESRQIAELEIHLHAARDPALREITRSCFDAYEQFAATALEALNIPEPGRHAAHVVALMFGSSVRQLSTDDRPAGALADSLRTLARGALMTANDHEGAAR